jgi:hypothetical protein
MLTSCAKTMLDASRSSDIASMRSDFTDAKRASSFVVSVQATHSGSVGQGYLGTFLAKLLGNCRGREKVLGSLAEDCLPHGTHEKEPPRSAQPTSPWLKARFGTALQQPEKQSLFLISFAQNVLIIILCVAKSILFRSAARVLKVRSQSRRRASLVVMDNCADTFTTMNNSPEAESSEFPMPNTRFGTSIS